MVQDNPMSTQKFTHGGARPGAGRPKSNTEPRKAHSFSCTDAEAECLKKLLTFLRAHSELIEKYCTKLVQEQASSTSFFGIKITNELQWLKSEETRSDSLINKLDSNEFQWLESAEEKAMTKKEKECVQSKNDYSARVIAEILVQA